MPSRFSGRILAHLTHDNYRPAPVSEIERRMQIPGEDADIFEQAIDLLVDQGRVEVGSDENVRLPAYGDEV
ncbi:MAG: hypothetical protein GY704_11875, partial [Phycisphaeraceae bacterium]|nr:hypothetical protein [Phycisphaeraceae bacterium]